MSAEVHLLSGQKIGSQGQPDANVVRELEWLLKAAKDGQLSGIAYAATYADGGTTNRYVGVISLKQVGALFAVMGRISREVDAL